MTPETVIANLQYIADSPAQEHGGFQEQTIETAKGALELIEKLGFKPTEQA